MTKTDDKAGGLTPAPHIEDTLLALCEKATAEAQSDESWAYIDAVISPKGRSTVAALIGVVKAARRVYDYETLASDGNRRYEPDEEEFIALRDALATLDALGQTEEK